MKKFLILAVLTGTLVVPASASAHLLSNGSARPLANNVCRAINNVPAEENPYVCRRVGAARRRSAHAILYPLSLHDPNDGERCTAVVRVRFRSSRSFSRVAVAAGHDCLVNPFAGV